MPFGTLPLSSFAVGPRATALYNPNEQAVVPQSPMGMMFRGFGGQKPMQQASAAFGFNRQPFTTPPYSPGAPVGPDTPAPLIGSFNPTSAQNGAAGAPGGYVEPTAGQQRPKFFGKGGAGWDVLSSIGDSLMMLSGMPGAAELVGARRQAQSQAQARQWQVQDRERERQLENQQWLERQIWEREHPKPINNDTAADYEFLKQRLGPEVADQYLRNFAAGPITAVDGFDAQGNPTKTFVPRGSLGGGMMPGGGAGPDLDPAPTRPVGKLRPPRGGAPSQGGASFR
ncbi:MULTISPECIES: hypothetical protein [unclassified Sphingomonas]|uniref:hypothetical protein n=1 Tax=unclassified Sphingomonas TaxID=196159 RepID=UPI000A4B9D36|nr:MULTISPECIES: hypothetical protein [unclassified Sphingomonas]